MNPDTPTADEQRRFSMGFRDERKSPKKIDADYWWAISSLTAREAAMLLCQFSPMDDANDPATTTTNETGPEDFKRLLRVFEDVEKSNPEARTLRQWLAVARDKETKYHSWIDEYVAGMLSENPADSDDAGDALIVDGGGTAADDVTPSKSTDKVASPACSDFRSMPNLMASEVTIEFTAGELGAVILAISARELSRRIGLLELGLVDRRNGNTDEQGLLLLGMAQTRTVSSTDMKIAKRIERLRDALQLHLGITDNPIAPFRKGIGYRARFNVVDNRGAADTRAKREAQRRKESLEELQGRGMQFSDATEGDHSYENEADMAGDAADEWLKRNES